jgi:hypothetical protein
VDVAAAYVLVVALLSIEEVAGGFEGGELRRFRSLYKYLAKLYCHTIRGLTLDPGLKVAQFRNRLFEPESNWDKIVVLQ